MNFIPENEMGVVVYFAQRIASVDNVSFLSIRAEYPDAVLLIDGTEYCTEFEYLSSNFLSHRHDPRKCDLIICWVDDIKHKNKLPVWEMSKGEWKSFVAPTVDIARKEAWYWEVRAKKAEKRIKQVSNKNAPLINDSTLDQAKRILNEVLLDGGKISGAELGRRLGKSGTLGRKLKNELWAEAAIESETIAQPNGKMEVIG